jgi:hypothetical protein
LARRQGGLRVGQSRQGQAQPQQESEWGEHRPSL